MLLLISCAHHSPLTKKGKEVVIMKPEEGKCKKLNDILVFPFFGQKNALNLENRFRNDIAELDGNVGYPMRVNIFQPSLEGIAYRCPNDYVQQHINSLLD